MENVACFQDLLKKLNEFSQLVLNILDNNSGSEELFQNLTHFIDDHNIRQEKSDLKLILHTISNISNNHYRTSNFFSKIERILQLFSNEIKNFYTNFEIFSIFKENKRILLFLFEEKIITPDKKIFQVITSEEYRDKNFHVYFLPEFNSFYDQKALNDIQSENKIDYKSPSFLENRKIGENESPACLLIRNDSVDQFISQFGKKKSSWLSKDVTESVFETNPLLYQKDPSFIEYSAFFGSVKIFKYLLKEKKKIDNSILSLAIHGKNVEIIDLIAEQFKIKASDMALVECFVETLKTFHNELTVYLFDKYFKNPLIKKKLSTNCLKYYNFISFIDDMINEVTQSYKNCIEKPNQASNDMFINLCESDYIKFVELFLKEKNLNVNAILKAEKRNRTSKNTALQLALLNNNNEIVNLLLQRDDIDFNIISSNSNDNTEISKIILTKKGIDINGKCHIISESDRYTTETEKTPLAIAVENENIEIIKALLAYPGIDINAKSSYFKFKSDYDEVGDREISENKTALHIALLKGNVEIVELLLSAPNIDINAQLILKDGNTNDLDNMMEYNKRTPLSLAIETGKPRIVELLLSHNEVDVNAKLKSKDASAGGGALHEDIVDQTPLILAVVNNNAEIVKLLLSRNNISINEKYIRTLKRTCPNDEYYGFGNNDYKKVTKLPILNIAAKNGNVEIVKLLLSYPNIDINAKDDKGKTATQVTKNSEIKDLIMNAQKQA